MGRTHMRALADSTTVRIAAIAEPSATQREQLASIGVPVHNGVEEMLDAGHLDGALIAAPTPLHFDLIRRVLSHRVPVLCEKPCGASPEQAAEATRLAEGSGIPLQVAYWRRFVPALCRLRERIAAGEFGDLYLATCYQWDSEPPAASFRAASGGIFVDMGVHEFDQLRWLTGQEIAEIHAEASQAVSEPAVSGDAESAQALCRLSRGASAFVSLGRRFPAGDACWAQVFGTRNAEECRFLWPPDAEAVFFQALRSQAESFARYAGGGQREGAQGTDAIAALIAAHSASQACNYRREAR